MDAIKLQRSYIHRSKIWLKLRRESDSHEQVRKIGKIQKEKIQFQEERAEQAEGTEKLRSRHTYNRLKAVGLECRD